MTSPWRPAITIPYPTLLSHSPDKPANDTHPPSPRPLKIPNACHFRSSATSPHGGHSSRGCHHAAAGIGAPAGHEPSRRLSRGVQLLLLWRRVHLLLSGQEIGVGIWPYNSAPSTVTPNHRAPTSTAVLTTPLALGSLAQRLILPDNTKLGLVYVRMVRLREAGYVMARGALTGLAWG